jgi:phosphopantothenoylcysteine decarboxylase/phosphopantothenate--cysteine ligase
MAAAVADYRVEHPADSKLKKVDLGNTLDLHLVQNPDILAGLVQSRGDSVSPYLVGFAAESDTARLETLALEKVARKGCDLLVANDISGSKVFGADTTAVAVVHAQDGVIARFEGQKSTVADELLSVIRDQLRERNINS